MKATPILALIPARGGSKGIPRKNLLPLAGRPLIAWTIESARATPGVDRVVVTTDDAEIEQVARAWGAEVVRRPAAISGDSATSESALLHALEHLRKVERYDPALVVFLQATSPLRRWNDIQGAIEALRRERADSLFSACALHGFVWRRSRTRWTSLSYDYRRRKRRQELSEDVVENGSIYVFRPKILRKSGNRLGGRIAIYRMDPLDSFQVDVPEDVTLIERILVARARGAGGDPRLASISLLVCDFDGVMTDNRVLVDQEGAEAVWCDRGDGWGIARLRDAGVDVAVLSTEKNPVVAARCRKLGIACVQGSNDKLGALRGLASERDLPARKIAYIGNDVNDLACLEWVGLPIAVADAVAEARARARLITTRPGGRGAVREIADAILAARVGPGAARSGHRERREDGNPE